MIKKFLIKAVIMVVILLGLASYASYLLTGQAPAAFFGNMFSGLKKQHAENIGELRSLEMVHSRKVQGGEALEAGSATMYKWRDADGVIHYTTEPPPADVQATAMTGEENVSVIPATPKAESATKSQQQVDQVSPQANTTDNIPNPYTPGGVTEIMRQAKDAQKQMQQRADQQKNVIESL